MFTSPYHTHIIFLLYIISYYLIKCVFYDKLKLTRLSNYLFLLFYIRIHSLMSSQFLNLLIFKQKCPEAIYDLMLEQRQNKINGKYMINLKSGLVVQNFWEFIIVV